jgi:hypothetical protein
MSSLSIQYTLFFHLISLLLVVTWTTSTPERALMAQTAGSSVFYVNSFEQENPLAGWSGSRELWKLIDDSERGMSLEGIGARGKGLNAPLVILGKQEPEWLEQTDLVIRFSFNIQSGSDQSGARFFYRASAEGYYVIEFFPGTATFKTGKGDLSGEINRSLESRIGDVKRGLYTDTRVWHDVILWINDLRLYIYIDDQLVASFENIFPLLPAGQIALQAIGNEPVRFDDVAVQRAITGSLHFSGQGLPAEYFYENREKISQEFDPYNGNLFLRITGATQVRNIYVTDDFSFYCRIRNDGRSYSLWLRHSENGRLVVGPDAGGFTVVQAIDGQDAVLWEWKPERKVPFHGPNRWADVAVTLIGNRLRIAIDSQVRFDAEVPDIPESGDFMVVTPQKQDTVGLDDCLLLEATPGV